MGEKRRTNIYVETEIVQLAKDKLLATTGSENLSFLVNTLLEEYIFDGEPPGENTIRAQFRALMARKRKEREAQLQITREEKTAHELVEEYRRTRDRAVRSATTSTLAGIKNFERMWPINDMDCEYCTDLDRIMNRISEKSGYEVEFGEVAHIWKEMNRKEPVSPEEHGASSLYQSVPAPSHSPKEMRANVHETPTD